ncbi:MAG: caspase family protein [Leptolyngbyaceae cyanobacterium bins.59]|nr:caspase family protein [Leptolyngbyaceae cyanobacterium bins.59]
MGLLTSIVWGFQTAYHLTLNPVTDLLPTPFFPVIHPGMGVQLAQTLRTPQTCQSPQAQKFLVFGGGGAPSYNEIALEKNVLYFQRTLRTLGYDPAKAAYFFANGTNGQATIRYLDPQGRQRFKVPQIPNLIGASTPTNLQRSLQTMGRQSSGKDSLFFYFTGHGIKNKQDDNNNAIMLWRDQPVTVQQFTQLLDRLPQETSVVTVMVQCYSGSFANLIYQKGDPDRAIALQNRCGFFATVKTLPSVGCTPAVNEADYRDYSSSFFAGLSGRSRIGQIVPSADYNQDGRVSYGEAHAFAKVDGKTTDLPISTSEAWLQRQMAEREQDGLLNQSIAQILRTARPEQRYVVNSLVQQFSFNPELPFGRNMRQLSQSRYARDEQQAYLIRLRTELLNIALERQVRGSGSVQNIATLDRLLSCEGGSWGR